MHFSIPGTEELYEDPTNKKNQYTTYQIHLNGGYLCSVRYSRIYQLNEELKKKFSPEALGEFPEKRLMSLSGEQVEERRDGLEKYLQRISQDPDIASGDVFVEFMKSLLQERHTEHIPVELPIYLVNGNKVFVSCLSSDQTDDIFEAICRDIELPSELTYYFGLFVIEVEGSHTGRIVRKLQDFECPYLALKQAPRRSILQAFWNKELDHKVLQMDQGDVALNILYIQVANDIKAGHFSVTESEQQRMAACKKAGDRKGFLDIARENKDYGQISLTNVVTNTPASGTPCTLALMSGCLKIIRPNADEMVFPVTRIRCWKIQEVDDTFELSFHFLRAKDDLIWIELKSIHGIFASMCIQSIVDEILRFKKGQDVRTPADRKSERVKEIRKVEPSEETVRAIEQQAVTPHVAPPVPKSPNAVSVVGQAVRCVSNSTLIY